MFSSTFILSQEGDAVLCTRDNSTTSKDMGAAASNSSSSTALPEKKYDVFISFRGEDTRGGFISHLRAHLHRKSVEVYVDDRLHKGDEISDSLTQAIQDSRISIVVFSKSYAYSKWCLNELTKILECKNLDGQIVVPVFHEIDPSHVRKQTGSYTEAFTKHEQELKDKEKLHKWKASLSEAANLAGWDSRNYRDQYILMENIVQDILQKLDDSYPSELQDVVVGIDESVEHITALLSKVPIVGIWGMGGIGKTTLCKAIFATLSSQYEGCCFLENVREELEKHGPKCLRRKLLNELLKREENRPASENQIFGTTFDMRRLHKKKVLIVLDDVTNTEQVTCFAGGYLCLNPNSRIIITSRDKHLLTSLGAHEIYKVKQLNYPESLKLFCLNAFNKNYPDTGFEQLSKKVLAYAKGLPLALKVLGSYLHSKTNKEWESALARLKKIPDKDIVSVLKLSYDGLSYEEKEIFLDIACFLNGELKALVINLLDSYGFYGDIGIRALLDKALITISASNQVMMHDLIKEMGQEIVCKESMKEPGRRTRLWDFEEVYDVLKNNKGTDANEGIILDVSQTRDFPLGADTFKKMPNLRFLKFYSSDYWNVESSKVYLRANIDSFSDKLRYFEWHGYPSQSLPSTFCAEKLVEFRMPYSHVRKLWDGVQDLVNLKIIDLHGSTQLMELPNFYKASSLKSVKLSYCTNLSHIHPSILSLHTLKSLDLYGCKKLKSLQSEVHLKSLKYLKLHHCSSLREFSLASEAIKYLEIVGTAIEILHSSIGSCSNLKELTLCDSMKNLPSNLSKLKSLESLRILYCRELDTLNFHIRLGSLPSLRKLSLTDCFNLSQLPDNIKYLSCLTSLKIRNSKNLLYISELPPSLEKLHALNCTSLQTIITPTTLQCSLRCCFLTNCVKLDEHSLSSIIELAYLSIKQAALCSDDFSIEFFLPRNRVPSWFRHQRRQNLISIEIPPCSHLLGFALCCIISPEFLPNQGEYLYSLGCLCYWEDTQSRIFTGRLYCSFEDPDYAELISDHMYIWYIPLNCYEIFIAMTEQRAKGRSIEKLFFKFFDCANRETGTLMGNAIKECGVWPIYTSEYENSMNELEQSLGFKLGYRTDNSDEQQQFFDLTAEDLKPSFLPTELEFDELRPSAVGTGVAISIFDHQEQDISSQNARQDLAEINSSCLLNRFSELDRSASEMEVNLELGLGNKTKRFRDMDDNQQLQRKKSNKREDIDELLRGASTGGIGVGCSQFDCIHHDELQPFTSH